MRVILLVTDLQRGGTPLRIARLARGLHAAGAQPTVACLAPPGPVSTELEAAGIPTFACDARGPRDFAALARLNARVRRIRPDLIHATLVHANVAARLVGLLRHIPVLTATATIECERPWHIWLERLTARLDAGHIVNSPAVADHVVRRFRRPRSRVYLVPPSLEHFPQVVDRIEARRRLNIPDHEFVVAWLGRFDPVKRLDLVIRVAEILTTVPTRFLLIGDGPTRGQIEHSLRLSNAGRVTHLLGWHEDSGPILSAADAFLFPSLTEGMPNAVLEAMACGLPIVASDLPVLRDIAGRSERLWLVSSNEPNAYATRLLQLRDDPATRSALAHRAATWARDHLDPAATIKAALAIYEAILGRPARAS